MNTDPRTIHLTLHEGAARLDDAQVDAIKQLAGELHRFQPPFETWELWLGLSKVVCQWLDIDSSIRAEHREGEGLLLFTHQQYGTVATIRQD